MSNATLIDRLRTLTERLGAGNITIREFADALPGHISALENMPYARSKKAEMMAVRIGVLADYDEEGCDIRQGVQEALSWLNDWLQTIPMKSSESNRE